MRFLGRHLLSCSGYAKLPLCFLRNDWGNFAFSGSAPLSVALIQKNYLCVFWKTTEAILRFLACHSWPFSGLARITFAFSEKRLRQFWIPLLNVFWLLKNYLYFFWKTTEAILNSPPQYFLTTQKLPLRFLRNDWGNYAFSGQAPLIVIWLRKNDPCVFWETTEVILRFLGLHPSALPLIQKN